MKKFLIAFILLPAISLTVFLYLNKGTIGKPREISEKQFKVNEITCQSCVQKIEQTLKSKHIQRTKFDIENKTITLKYDINKYKVEKSLGKELPSFLFSKDLKVGSSCTQT